MKKLLVLNVLLLSFAANAGVKDKIKKLNWDGIDVVWLEDERFPTYSMNVYFADGALSDEKGYEGETSIMFDLLDSGTRRFSHEDIVDNLEFYGVSYGGTVTHEYSTYSISGLVKDIVPTMKKICHMYVDATFPKNVINKELKRAKNGIQNLVNNPGALASRAFRELSMAGSGFDYPAEGKLKNLKNIYSERLKKKLDYFNTKVNKRIYIAGPKSALVVKNTLASDCNWKSEANYVRDPGKVENLNQAKPTIHLVTVPKANQAQVRIGRYLGSGEIDKDELKSLLSEYLGGGFTSQLMREIRVKRGLTYGIGSFVGSQKLYGRSGISTFTKNNTTGEIIEEIKKVIENLQNGNVEKNDFERAKSGLAGSHPFRFENLNSFLGQLLYFDHIGRDYNELYEFQEKVKGYGVQDIISESQSVFDWNKQTIVILGSKELLEQLKKLGDVKVHDYKKFL